MPTMIGLGRSWLKVGALAGIVALMWVLLIPPQAGPDEPDHLVRAAALARGQLDGGPSPYNGASAGFELPAWINQPKPNCYKFLLTEPATCATQKDLPSGDRVLGTRADGYQVWGHLLAGVGSYAPASTASTASRILDAAIPVAALGLVFALAARRGWLPLGAAVLAVTPMAWFMFAVVNPSGLVIAGGLLAWMALVSAERAPPALIGWMFAVGWALLVLPRRDGMIWAVLALSFAMLTLDLGLREWMRAIGRGPQILVAASTFATLAWAVRSDTNSARALLLMPFVPLVAAAGRRAWRAPWMASTTRRVVAVIGLVGLGAIGSLLVMDTRRSGFDRGAFRNVVLRTGEDILEAIGNLGWLDTPLPASLVYLWLVTLGLLVAAVLVEGRMRLLAGSAAVLASAIWTSWILTMLQNQPLGTYWQGRYYLPLLVGIPMLLGMAHLDAPVARRLGRAVLAVGLVVTNVGLGAAVRRWADGVDGTLLPWEWDTYDTVVPPIVLLAVHAGATVGIWLWAAHELRPGANGVVSLDDVDGDVNHDPVVVD